MMNDAPSFVCCLNYGVCIASASCCTRWINGALLRADRDLMPEPCNQSAETHAGCISRGQAMMEVIVCIIAFHYSPAFFYPSFNFRLGLLTLALVAITNMRAASRYLIRN